MLSQAFQARDEDRQARRVDEVEMSQIHGDGAHAAAHQADDLLA